MTRLLRFLCRGIAAAILFFLSVVCLITLGRLPVTFDQRIVIPLSAGFAGGMIFFTCVSRLPFLYVCGHEITHWFAAKFFLRETGPMAVAGHGGSVHVERPNIWIVLAPYFIPVYAVVWTGIYGLVQMFWRDSPGWLTIAYTVGLGITYAFHVRMTIYALSRAQSDLGMHGPVLSLTLIAFCNLALILACIIVASGEWSRGLGTFWHELVAGSRQLARFAAAGARLIAQVFKGG